MGSPLGFGTGCRVFVPPGGVNRVENAGPENWRFCSACCPEDPQRHVIEPLPAGPGDPPKLMVHEDDREAIRAGQDRVFRSLVYTDLGCEQVTQFVGWIPSSKAPFHLHTYEEYIFILERNGILP